MSFEFATPQDARACLVAQLRPVATEICRLDQADGRVLAEQVCADRDSPPHDVSAMDGYAVRAADCHPGQLPVAGAIAIGQPPPNLPLGAALKIVTGACVPPEADLVVMREDVGESGSSIELGADSNHLRLGQHIRRRGENLREGAVVVAAGTELKPPVVGSLATVGAAEIKVFRRVRVRVLITGNELRAVGERTTDWQIRDANGPALAALLRQRPWIDLVDRRHVTDDLAELEREFAAAFAEADAVLVTGGVSMGDHDHVPEALLRAGGQRVFHRLPIRPGKPLLGGIGPDGQLVLGLPGNPVSVLTTAQFFALPLLGRRAGLDRVAEPGEARLRETDGQTLGLWWYRLVRVVGEGEVELVQSRGSGDMISAAQSDGFILLPPRSSGSGPWPLYRW